MTVVFAILLACVASVVRAENGDANFYYGTATDIRFGSAERSHGAGDRVPIDRGATSPAAAAEFRPAYLEMSARLASFDSDSDPDGWCVEIVLRDRKDRPTTIRSHARFELRGRISTVNAGRYVNAQDVPVRWSMPLNFDQDGVAVVQLPLRHRLKPMLRRSSLGIPSLSARGTPLGYPSDSRARQRRSFLTPTAREGIGVADVGELRVILTVPTEGRFEASACVRMRPPVLVDTRWPYR